MKVMPQGVGVSSSDSLVFRKYLIDVLRFIEVNSILRTFDIPSRQVVGTHLLIRDAKNLIGMINR
jgi:hypothetical protein